MNTPDEKASTGWSERLPEEELKRRIARFKELVRQGKPIRKSLRESGLQPRDYKRYYDDIWGDPDMAGFRPKKAGQREEEKPSEVVQAERRLREYGFGVEEKTQFERDFEIWRGRGRP